MNAPREVAADATTAAAPIPHAGFGNHFESEALPGALPVGRNNPQRPAHGLFAELLSGTAFTAPRDHNRRTWLYRRRPSAVVGPARPYAQPWIRTGAAMGLPAAPDPLRWHPPALPPEGAAPVDFVDGLRTMVVNGDPALHTGVAVHVYLANASMRARAFSCADGELLIVPQLGTLKIRTELGVLVASPGDIALIPRGMVFRVEVDGPVRGFVAENHGAAFRLPELGPIGSNGLANARDFRAPGASLEPDAGPVELVRKSGGALWTSILPSTPFDVAAWHGNLVPMVYDTRRFNTIGTVSFDHPDPSIFTVLTSPSDTPGWANADFVIFPPRWMVAEDTFRPPWYHRNVMSEFMGLVYGQYDAKPEGFRPGGTSLHNSFVPHGPDAEAWERATNAPLAPHKLDQTLAFMVESRWPFRLTEYALHGGHLDERYADCWAPLARRPLP